MKKDSIEKIINPIMNIIWNANINSEDKTELLIMIGRFLENYDFKKYCEIIYEKKLVRKK